MVSLVLFSPSHCPSPPLSEYKISTWPVVYQYSGKKIVLGDKSQVESQRISDLSADILCLVRHVVVCYYNFLDSFLYFFENIYNNLFKVFLIRSTSGPSQAYFLLTVFFPLGMWCIFLFLCRSYFCCCWNLMFLIIYFRKSDFLSFPLGLFCW